MKQGEYQNLHTCTQTVNTIRKVMWLPMLGIKGNFSLKMYIYKNAKDMGNDDKDWLLKGKFNEYSKQSCVCLWSAPKQQFTHMSYPSSQIAGLSPPSPVHVCESNLQDPHGHCLSGSLLYSWLLFVHLLYNWLYSHHNAYDNGYLWLSACYHKTL